MAHYLDMSTWPRRDLFEFYRTFDKPYFNICTNVNVTNLFAARRHSTDFSIALAFHYFALRIANDIEPFRYRLRGDQVLVHDVINGGTTLLLPNETFTLIYFDYLTDFWEFITSTSQIAADTRAGDGAFRPRHEDDARIHFTTLPWISFTSFSHARNWGRQDSVPKIAFGKFFEEDGRMLLPLSVEVHHSLVDGLHVGRFVTRLEEAFSNAERYIHPDSAMVSVGDE
ncbi:MAG TPA: CatA-like O-acetyltransferase [Pyrinomonadaceae bacterium]